MIDRSLFTPDGSNPPIPVPFGFNQTVPTEEMAYLFANLCGEAKSVLEIGTGSGYQTAVLAEKYDMVVSVEIDPTFIVMDRLPSNVVLVYADGLDYNTGEKFDVVLVTFASHRIAHSWFLQVREGGKLVVPIQLKRDGLCRICVYEKQHGQLKLINIPAYAPFTATQEA